MEERELELPELPEPTTLGCIMDECEAFTDDQMRAYGAECARLNVTSRSSSTPSRQTG